MPKKRRPGQPTKYRPEYCEKLIAHCKEGLSFESFGATIGVARDAVYEWAKKHPEFSEAKRIGTDESLLWWEKQAKFGLWTDREGMQFNTTLWVFSMKNKHGWRDNKDIKSSREITLKIGEMPEEELLALGKEAIKAIEGQ